MVNVVKSIHWLCGECGNDFDYEDQAEACCSELEEKKDES